MATTTTPSFPIVTGENLLGEPYELPGALEAARNLLLVAFRRDQQAAVDTWLPLADALEDEYHYLRYYEIPVISRYYRPFRWFIDGGMRTGIPDEETRERTITVYTDTPTFRRALDLPTDSTIYALLVDRDGRVHWRAEGPLTDVAARDLRDHLADSE